MLFRVVFQQISRCSKSYKEADVGLAMNSIYGMQTIHGMSPSDLRVMLHSEY